MLTDSDVNKCGLALLDFSNDRSLWIAPTALQMVLAG
jgi:hypothetical protein